ncbi:MAG TPA: hypothetical protein VJL81_16970 [Solirubrobacterales bacterium]|nr:hypothetical protein [Solirubrobacterales bacterium]
MKVDYDSEARSLLFEFGEFRYSEPGDYTEELAGGTCLVWIHDDRPESIQLLSADDDIARLDEAAERSDLDAEGLRAGARAALAAPDREIRIEVGKNLAEAEQEEAKAA